MVAKNLKSRILLYELGDQFIRGNQTLLVGEVSNTEISAACL